MSAVASRRRAVPVSGPLMPFGHEWHGGDLYSADAPVFRRFTASLGKEGLAVLRNQPADDDSFTALLRRLGTLTFTAGEAPLDSYPHLNGVSNRGRDTPPRSVFHTDTSYRAEPPSFTALRAVEVPSRGGETLVANQFIAYERLPRNVRRQLREVRVRHVASRIALGHNDESEAWHPLFRRHPVSKRIALFLSTPERCVAVEGLDSDSSQRLIASLYEHATRDALVYRHGWKPGDILVWDNRCTLHRADHSDVVGNRTFHRGMVAGERPIAAFS